VPFGDETRKIRGSHTREILHVRNGGFAIIADTLAASGNGDHVFEALFHHPGATAAVREKPLRVEVNKSKAALTVVPLLPDDTSARIVQGQKEPFLLGWSMTGEPGKYRPEPVSVFRDEGSGTVRMAWLLLPHPADTPPDMGSLKITRQQDLDLVTWRDKGGARFFVRIHHGRSGLDFLQQKPDGSKLRFDSPPNP
jgi:hypothetical protein